VIMEPTTCLVIPADLDEIPKISAVIEEVMQTQEYSREAILDMQLAVEESVVNTILHGYCGTAGEVVISVYATTDSIAVRIEDRAPPFDPLSLPDPDFGSDLAERRVGGLGGLPDATRSG
jgi:Anti-sigma regulatory factor (Ser/Thr protein kinase)